jgi:hypothetical protein
VDERGQQSKLKYRLGYICHAQEVTGNLVAT